MITLLSRVLTLKTMRALKTSISIALTLNLFACIILALTNINFWALVSIAVVDCIALYLINKPDEKSIPKIP